MAVDQNLFFREITKRLFNIWEIEEALLDCMRYLRTQIPADLLILQYTNIEAGTHRVVATATKDEGKRWDTSIPFSPSARKAAAERTMEAMKTKRLVILSNHPEEGEDLKTVQDFFGLGPSSLMVIGLETGGRMVGSLALFADGNDRFTDDHARLFEVCQQPAAVALLNSHMYQENRRMMEMLKDENQFLRKELQYRSGTNIVGASFGLKGVMDMVQQVAARDSPVLLLGETGTGKDLIANAIHQSSNRKDGPYIAVNCGAIPDSLLDSELFGHEKGAFTGALSQKRGRFERANQGTIFLDEIGELPLAAQVRLLRVLQNREIERVGGDKSISVDIRIIAATNRDLEAMIKEGTFREDLWFRLNVFPINIPPLRERVADVPALAEFFIDQKTIELKIRPKPKIQADTLKALEAYHWPGNVRELENIIERALIISQGPFLDVPDLVPSQRPKTTIQPRSASDRLPSFDETVTAYLTEVLDITSGKIHGAGGAAEITGLNPSTLRSKLRKLGIRDK